MGLFGEGDDGRKKLADHTRDELIDELVRSEQRETELAVSLQQAKDDTSAAVERLEQSESRDVQQNLADALAKAERLWLGINRWYDQHKRACQYAMQPDGFCAECVWVKRIIDTEKEIEPHDFGSKHIGQETPGG